MNKDQRLKIVIRGAVQGVGFRPFVYKLAKSMALPGWVINSSQGVFIEIEGEKRILDEFLVRLEGEKPVHAFIQSLESSYLDPVGFNRFEIRKSADTGAKTVVVLPDIAACPQCLEEVFDPQNRRYLYPFTNCTLCGPRYTIIESLPYDRPHTSMKHFPMCPECRREYEDPEDRRFHAQPNACPACGPCVSLWNPAGEVLSEHLNAIHQAVDRLKEGGIVAIKGLGGFHLMADASNEGAIDELRRRKRRNEKPLAVMVPSLQKAMMECEVGVIERRLLTSSEAPIVLLNRKKNPTGSEISESVAPGNPTVGIMLPYTPLHHILMEKAGFPLVATSGNISDEPICIDEREALKRLSGIADLFLVHNRPIIRHVDDSLVRVTAGREQVLRRSRGYAPLPVTCKVNNTGALAVGAHQKNTVALQIGDNAIVSQHIGDLETEQALGAFRESIESLQALYETKPGRVIRDLHPGYLSSEYAEQCGLQVTTIQHHHAHIASCMAENQLQGRVLGISWDGTGAGTDGTIWGGEFLLGDQHSMKRFSHLKPFRLPGAEQAVKEPRRSALGILYEVFGSDTRELSDIPSIQAFESSELSLLLQMLEKGFNSPVTSSMGRLFDAVSSLSGIRQVASFEGQGAMELEFTTGDLQVSGHYPFELHSEIDWRPMIRSIIDDLKNGLSKANLSAKFHNSLAEMIVTVAKNAGEQRVVLSGGCFQNRILTERAIARLQEEGFNVYWHQRIPPNDGGISLGQLYAGLQE